METNRFGGPTLDVVRLNTEQDMPPSPGTRKKDRMKKVELII